jgi:hypothetical protein
VFFFIERQAAEPPASGVLLAAHVRPFFLIQIFSLIFLSFSHYPQECIKYIVLVYNHKCGYVSVVLTMCFLILRKARRPYLE